jgi:hypothetical protein
MSDDHPGFWLNPATGRFISKASRTYNSIKRAELFEEQNITISKTKPPEKTADTPAPAPAPTPPPPPPPPPLTAAQKAALERAEKVALFWKLNEYKP